MIAWVCEEMQGLDLKDKRTDRRAKMVLSDLANVAESTPDAVRSKAALDGTYRLMDNPKVSPDELLAPHHRQTIARTAKHSRVLLVQDTTEVDLTKPKRQVAGAGPLESPARRGFYLHPLMAYTPAGVPLGLVGNLSWTRIAIDTKSTEDAKKRRRNATPIEEKESHRWVLMTRLGRQAAEKNPETEYVGVSDSESDIYEVFAELADCSENYHILVRACQDRAITACNVQGGDGSAAEAKTIGDALRGAPVRWRTQVSVRGRRSKTQAETRARRQSREDRVADVKVRAIDVTVRPPYRPGRKLPAVTFNVVEVREPDPPREEPPLVWILITTLPIDDDQAIAEIIAHYKVRWNIEVYFRTLKSGLGLEKLRYQKIERYLNATMLLMIVAWRVQMLTHAARAQPEGSCEEYYTEEEWQPVCLISHPDRDPSAGPPTMGEFLLMVATLGGYINRKGQGPPGVTTVWRGIRRIEMLTLAYATFGPGKKKTCEV